MLVRSLAVAGWMLFVGVPLLTGAPPKVLDPRLQLELLAEAPMLVTPVGVAIDSHGRIFVVESHTHFPPKDYRGPKTDRIRVFSDSTGDGRPDRVTTFFEGTRHTMSLAFGPGDWLYVATRSQVLRLKDTKGTGTADVRENLVTLESKGNYPHNGLAGFAFDTQGRMVFGFGENLGEAYTLIGRDGVQLSGGGEGGNIYRCEADGTKLERIATGFWNPFHMTFDTAGRLFAVDNDPDSRPPCRLLHIVEGGDYGYRFRNGRRGTHPFTAWNGELPGTLPMVAGTGEAPSGILQWRHPQTPADFRGHLVVTSWGDHRLELYRLSPRGASFGATMIPLVQGGSDFRPVAIVEAQDGSLIFSDWVDRSYELHGKGRLWRLRVQSEQPQSKDPLVTNKPTPGEIRVQELAGLKAPNDRPRLLAALGDTDPFVRHAAWRRLGQQLNLDDWLMLARHENSAVRLGALLALRESTEPRAAESLVAFLADADPLVRQAAVQWVAEAQLQEHRPAVAHVLAIRHATRGLFEAARAAQEMLDGRPAKAVEEGSGARFAFTTLMNPQTPVAVRRWALRLVPANYPDLTPERLIGWLQSDDGEMRIEAVRSLRQQTHPLVQPTLVRLANDPNASPALRAEAILGLDAESAHGRAALLQLATQGPDLVRQEALRSLQGIGLSDMELSTLANADDPLVRRVRKLPRTEPLPPADDTAAWLKLLEGAADAAVGERIFFHPRGPGCYKCHTFEGRGQPVGPDLSTTARQLTRERLVESILQPSREIAPMYVQWLVLTTDGRQRQGVLVTESGDITQTYADAEGKTFVVKREDREDRRPLPTSIMPANLHELMTLQEFRDLLAFLRTTQR